MTKPKKLILAPPREPVDDAPDPSLDPTRCQAPGCDVVKPLGAMIGYKVQLFLSGHPKIAAMMCPDELHYGCSYEHALLVAHACLDEHIHPAHRAAVESHFTTEEAPDVER